MERCLELEGHTSLWSETFMVVVFAAACAASVAAITWLVVLASCFYLKVSRFSEAKGSFKVILSLQELLRGSLES